jgi:hypothetical protein
MKFSAFLVAAVASAVFVPFGQANADAVNYTGPVTVSYYDPNNFNDTGNNIVFGTSYMTDLVSGISELRDLGGGDTDPNWPDAGIEFAADFTATIDVPKAGDYTFNFGTDDAGYLFINGVLIANQGGVHGIGILPYTVFLPAGDLSLEVQYDNILCCGAVAFLGLPVPEPDTLGLLGLALISVGGLGMRRKFV